MHYLGARPLNVVRRSKWHQGFHDGDTYGGRATATVLLRTLLMPPEHRMDAGTSRFLQPDCLLQISIVSQEPVLFAESILYNICFGMPKGTEGVSREQARDF